eukprot:m.330500 g.330500  ORF g.330500 m.330500 type:complete len:949 (-) comp27720_c0_seq4:150-2996(-)
MSSRQQQPPSGVQRHDCAQPSGLAGEAVEAPGHDATTATRSTLSHSAGCSDSSMLPQDRTRLESLGPPSLTLTAPAEATHSPTTTSTAAGMSEVNEDGVASRTNSCSRGLSATNSYGDAPSPVVTPPGTPPAWTAAGAKHCAMCSFSNAPDLVRCGICAAPLPPPGAPVFAFPNDGHGHTEAFPLLTEASIGHGVTAGHVQGRASNSPRKKPPQAEQQSPRELHLPPTIPADGFVERACKGATDRGNGAVGDKVWAGLERSGELVFTWKGGGYIFAGNRHAGHPVYEDTVVPGTKIFFEGDGDPQWYNNGGWGFMKEYSIGCSGEAALPPPGRGWIHCVSSKPCSVEVVYTDPFLALLQQEHPDAHRRLLAAEVYEAYFESNRAHADQIKEAVAKDSIKAFVKKAKAGKVYLATMIDLCLMLGPDPSRNSNHPTHEWLVALTDVHVAESDAIAAVIKATLEERCRVAEQADTAATTFDFLDGYIMRLLCEPVQTLIDSKRFGHVEKLNDKLHADCEWWYSIAMVEPIQEIFAQLLLREVESADLHHLVRVASASLADDRRIYTAIHDKEKNKDGYVALSIEAARFESEVHAQNKTRPLQPTARRYDTMSVAQAKLQAAGSHAPFCAVITDLADQSGAKATIPKMKRGFRMLQKCILRAMCEVGEPLADCRCVTDVNRGMITADSPAHFLRILDAIRNHPKVKIRWVKDRVNSPTSGGWADLLILFEVRGSNRHICEVQIGFKSMISARKEGEGHAAYMRARDAIEVIEATGGVFEFQCAAPKTSGDGSGEMAAGQDEPAESAPRDDALLENERLLKQVVELRKTLRVVRSAERKAGTRADYLERENEALRTALENTQIEIARMQHQLDRTNSGASPSRRVSSELGVERGRGRGKSRGVKSRRSRSGPMVVTRLDSTGSTSSSTGSPQAGNPPSHPFPKDNDSVGSSRS